MVLVVFEGSQAPCSTSTTAHIRFVTSSNTWRAGRAGAGVGPGSLDDVWASPRLPTRVGAGPFPTELDDPLGAQLREAGSEFGTTTGRARGRAGSIWLRCATQSG